ncbi:hypothetical protein CH063_02177 [Colletotrichum higginsianum]|uniref:Uncharacterized protein n=1 Tax=Colletotrichum higginsianum (strain IMI 349063) TaxID=759273 RepID=H1VHG4_COLHI|nr:hypothetical protein CH063_02177 [Colletotrichum higginsianum]
MRVGGCLSKQMTCLGRIVKALKITMLNPHSAWEITRRPPPTSILEAASTRLESDCSPHIFANLHHLAMARLTRHLCILGGLSSPFSPPTQPASLVIGLISSYVWVFSFVSNRQLVSARCQDGFSPGPCSVRSFHFGTGPLMNPFLNTRVKGNPKGFWPLTKGVLDALGI